MCGVSLPPTYHVLTNPQRSNNATARIGLPLPPLNFNGKPTNVNLPLPTTRSKLSSPSICVMPRSPQMLWARKFISPSGLGLMASTPVDYFCFVSLSDIEILIGERERGERERERDERKEGHPGF